MKNFTNFIQIKLSVFLICVLIGCVSTEYVQQHESKIVHIVLIWLNEPKNTNHLAEVIKTTRALQEIPEIEEIRVGESISSERPIVDDSFDVALFMVFDSKAALEAYLVHPKHKAAVKAVLRPLASRILVYDFEDHGRGF